MPPVPPPKPRLSGDQTTEETDSRIASRSHSALPASVRPPTSPSHVTPTDGRSTPRFEPDLVGKDRYVISFPGISL
ncbi:hypothetical protein AB6A40_009652 [Gnathostoma spinigerum]|uniref:Uncharacterized protein n=1 Tax=Gnathostoma spinigerum TaxID=75299 RepID=A0ABD6ESK9_9BILA